MHITESLYVHLVQTRSDLSAVSISETLTNVLHISITWVHLSYNHHWSDLRVKLDKAHHTAHLRYYIPLIETSLYQRCFFTSSAPKFTLHKWPIKRWTPLQASPNSKVHGANMGPNWVLSAPDGPHVGPMNFAIRVPHCEPRYTVRDCDGTSDPLLKDANVFMKELS